MTNEEFAAAKKASGPLVITTMHGKGETSKETYHECEQCGSLMNAAEWYCGPVCGKCCRKNHKKVLGR